MSIFEEYGTFKKINKKKKLFIKNSFKNIYTAHPFFLFRMSNFLSVCVCVCVCMCVCMCVCVCL